jgi:hypothetical protein
MRPRETRYWCRTSTRRAENATWVDWLVRFIRKNLPNFAKTFTPAELDGKSNAEIADRIQATFINFQKRVKALLGTDRAAKLARNKQFQRKKRVRTSIMGVVKIAEGKL